MILLIDSYDSFSYNLYQLVGALNPDIQVIRNDEKTVAEIRAMAPSHILLSPGPGRPEGAGVLMDVVQALGGEIPILGVCLGHQAICAALGGTVTYARQLMHGKQSQVTAATDEGEVMAVRHKVYPIYGLQFHPESILTPNGKTMLQNFLKEM